MHKTETTDRLISAKDNMQVMNDLIRDYKPFILSTVKDFKGKYVFDNDELSTTAMLAFKEAITSYNYNRGEFFSFAKRVIKRRLIDYYRKEKRYQEKEKLILTEENEVLNNIEYKKSIINYIDQLETEIRREEINELTVELNKMNITFDELTKCSPKSDKLRKLYYKAACCINESLILKSEVMKTYKLPIKLLTEKLCVNRKKIERGRKYILALLIILNGDYEYISKYIKME